MTRLKIIGFLVLNAVSFFGFRWFYDTRIPSLYDTLTPTVLELHGMGRFTRGHKTGQFGIVTGASGVLALKDGTIITCAHVVRHTRLFIVTGYKLNPYKAYLVGVDKTHDLALLRPCFPKATTKYVKLGIRPRIGSSVLVIGYPTDFKRHLSVGFVTEHAGGDDWFDARIDNGSSGGGVFDLTGHLVGIVFAYLATEEYPMWQGVSCATSVGPVKRLLERYTN